MQIQVEKCLQELASLNKAGTKVKSLRGVGAVEVLVPNHVKWSHEYILSGNSKERISYDQLSVTQWVAGFGRIMKEEKNPEIKDSMLDYLVSLFDDANDFSWDAAKASHAVLRCRMAQGEITSYNEVEKTDTVRRANAQRHTYPTSNVQTSKKMPQMPQNVLPVSSTKSHNVKSRARVTNTNVHRPSVNSYNHTKVYPARKTKNLGNTENVPVPLHKFQFLTDLNADDNGFVPHF